jgi:hypothetical protein
VIAVAAEQKRLLPAKSEYGIILGMYVPKSKSKSELLALHGDISGGKF